jgi:hypothetical protein
MCINLLRTNLINPFVYNGSCLSSHSNRNCIRPKLVKLLLSIEVTVTYFHVALVFWLVLMTVCVI